MKPLEYYAITHNEVFNLGAYKTFEEADYVAVDRFNMHCAHGGYIVVNHKELEAIKALLDKRGIGVF